MALVDERGCRRDIRSNGWIVFRESSLFQRVCCFKIGPAEETGFLRSVRNICSAISPGQKLSVKSGPDVFADALVPLGTPRSLGRLVPPGMPSIPLGGTCFLGTRSFPLPAQLVPGALISQNRFRSPAGTDCLRRAISYAPVTGRHEFSSPVSPMTGSSVPPLRCVLANHQPDRIIRRRRIRR